MNRRVILIGAAATLGLLAVWYLLLWSPQSTSLKTASSRATAALQKEATLKTQVASLQKLRTHLPELQAQLAQQQIAIPAAPKVDKFIDQWNAAAIASGVTILGFNPTPPAVAARATAVTTATTTAGAAPVTATTTPVAVAASPATSISLTMTIAGSYQQLVDFINRLTKLPRLTIVDGLAFTAPADKTSSSMNATITARVFEDPLAVTTTTTTTVGGH